MDSKTMLTPEREAKLIKLLQEMIQQQSFSGEEEGVAKVIEKNLLALGYDSVTFDKYGNVIGCIKGNKPGKKILFDGHIDTVTIPEGTREKWTQDPFKAEIVDGKLYGRGTSDMKGPDATFIAACAFFAEDCKKDFAGEIYVAGVVHEEIFEGVAAREISKNVKPDYVVIGETSELNLKIGQRGRGEIVIETFGKPAHSANPHEGINAVKKMAKVILEIEKIVPPTGSLGLGILELTDIKSSPYPGSSVVPSGCRATYDRRLLVGETKESVLKPIQEVLDRLMAEDAELKATVSYAYGKEKCYTGEFIEGERFFPGWHYSEQDEFVQMAMKGLTEAGINYNVTQYSFCTNGSHYAGEAGIQTIGFGPSTEILAHKIDEHIEIEQLRKGAAGYYGILKAVFNK